MGSLNEQFDALADRFFGALGAGDVEAAIDCYAPDARIWHNFDQITLSPAENAAVIRTYFTNFPVRDYRQVRRSFVPPDGLIQQHVVRLVGTDGRALDWPGCVILRIADGKIKLLEEYVDLASLAGGNA